MKFIACCLATMAICTATSAFSAEATESEGRAIEQQLDYYLPEGVAKDGLFRVHADDDHYTLTINPAALFTGIDKLMHPTEIQPLVLNLSRQADGLWNVSGKGNLKMAAEFTSSAGAKGKMLVDIRDIDVKMLFDPALGVPRTTAISLGKQTLSSAMDNGTLSITTRGLDITTSLTNLNSGIADLKLWLMAHDVAAESGPVPKKISVGTFQVDWNIGSFNVAGVRKVLGFILDQIRQGRTQMTASELKHFKTLVDAQLPFAQSLSQQYEIADIRYLNDGAGSLGLLKFDVDIGRDSNETKFNLLFSKPAFPPAMMPKDMQALLPETFKTDLALTGFHWNDGMAYVMNNANLSGDFTLEQKEEFRKVFVPDDRLVFSVDNGWTRSPLYEFQWTGKMVAYPGGSLPPDGHIRINAIELDTLLKYLDDHSAKMQIMASAAAIVRMYKGLAKLDQGSLLWDVTFNPTDRLKINGFALPH